MRSVFGVLAALVVSGSLIAAAEAQRRVALTDFCQELKLLQEVMKPGLTVESQAAVLTQAMRFPKFRELVKAHGERNFSAAEIDAALFDCRQGRQTQRPDPQPDPPVSRSSDPRDPQQAALWIVLALIASTAVAGILLVREMRNHRPEKSAPLRLAPLKRPPKHEPDWERNEGPGRRAELDEIRRAIEDRSRQ